MGAKPQPCYNQIRAINDRVIMRLQCIKKMPDIFLLCMNLLIETSRYC